MIKASFRQSGSAHVVIITILTILIFGALGFVFWQSFIRSPKPANENHVSQKNTEKLPFCTNSNNVVEKDGTFCSENIGVKFKIPKEFVGKFQKKENYAVFKGRTEDSKETAAGKSLAYYEAVVSAEEETLSLSVAKEPLRSGYSSIGHALQRTYFNETNGILSLVRAGEPVPSFEVDGIKVYHGKMGDAGTVEDGYLMVLKNSVVIIKIKHVASPMNAPVLDIGKIFAELDGYLKDLKFNK